MKRSYLIDSARAVDGYELAQRTAFHEAGHAASIYLGNKHRQLPPVFFRIIIKNSAPPASHAWVSYGQFTAVVEGGYLIHSLPYGLIESAGYFSSNVEDSYRLAIEADMVNLLAGPLAEAKYLALRDGECFGARQVNIDSLYRYGGDSDLRKINEYLGVFIASKAQREKTIDSLLDKAYRFILGAENWHAVECLAAYILTCGEGVIGCENAIAVLDDSYCRAEKFFAGKLIARFYSDI